MRAALFAMICLLSAGPAVTAESPQDRQYQMLQQDLQRLDGEAGEGGYGALERLRFRQALESYPQVRSRDREQALAMATILMQTADYAVKTGRLQTQLVELESERAAILVEASRRDAELARKEADRLRLAALAREEEEAMALQDLDPALPAEPSKVLTEAQARDAELARLEEELSAQVASNGEFLSRKTLNGKPGYVLSANAFKPGKASLNGEARLTLEQLAGKLKTGGKSWRIVGYTDNLGSEPANLQLSKQRAEAVLAVLKAAGIPAGKLSAKGMGSADPVASNAGKPGRAQNRRVEIIQK
jgi:outer membrane protein OmpA-like peptidoglycan-associated protein